MKDEIQKEKDELQKLIDLTLTNKNTINLTKRYFKQLTKRSKKSQKVSKPKNEC